MKAFVFCLMSFVLASAVFAQEELPRRMPGNRLQRPPTARTSQTSQTSQPSETSSSDEVPAFNWDAAPVDIVLQAYGERVGKTILKDPQVPAATITLKSQPGQKLTNEEYLEAIETVLEMNQIHLEPYGESFIRALPRKDARKQGIPLLDENGNPLFGEAKLGERGKVVSVMIKFNNIATEEAQKALEGLKSDSGILLVFERTNSILVTDTEQNINRMLEIAKMIDIASPVTEVVEYIQIKYASAQDVKTVIDNIVQESMKEQEKNGKTPQNQPQQQSSPVRPLLGGLRRPGQQQQQPAPVNNQSLVMTVSDADRGMIRGKVVTIADERSNKILLITNAQNMKFFKEVIAALDVETTPDTVVKVYRLKYAEAEDVSDMINDLIGNSSSSKSGGRANQNQASKSGTSGSVTRGNQTAAKKPANQRSGEAKAGELNKDNTTVLADKRINGIVVMTDKELVPTIEQIIESMDIKLSQVLIETTIIEVTLGDGIKTGMDWVQKGRQMGNANNGAAQRVNGMGNPLFDTKRTVNTYAPAYKDDGTIDPGKRGELIGTVVDYLPISSLEGYSRTTASADNLTETILGTGNPLFDIARDPKTVLNNWGGGNNIGLAGGASGGAMTQNLASNIFGKAFNFIFDSDELGLSAIIQASKTDSHSKYIASPVVMTLDNKEAVLEATAAKQFLTGWTANSSGYGGMGMPTPNYTGKDIGIKLKVTPKINPNGTVMLTVEEEYSQVSEKQTILAPSADGKSYSDSQIDVSTTRTMQSDVLLENNQTVVFGGLTQTSTIESETGIPILKDIPIIGKWLFGSVEQDEARVELLVFMTPYVLDDAQAAQAEALRRKKTMSDPRPWEDHGWSLSNLADPVSKKEQMRRIKDEWAKQDEERKTKIAIEKMKVERAKKLQEMSKEERDLWLKMHKKELDEEKQEELEEKMLDKESQEELRKLAAQVKKQRLEAAEKEIKAAADEAAAENERGKLEAEKKAKAEEK